ncbi:MAG: type II toxin-antitoxin system VapC family toxin [Methanomicrobiales archaeon]|nr:type II toxin-antitoxin system VapC family toxin [Methanomicrobiales archaeon]
MITNPEKRTRVLNLLAIADEYVILDDTIVSRARMFKKAGIRTLDALHLALAESVDAALLPQMTKLSK